jgi:hypothetical protein
LGKAFRASRRWAISTALKVSRVELMMPLSMRWSSQSR